MDAQQFTFGFRVAGGPHEPRRLVTWRKAWAAHCAGDVDTGEAYLSAWTYGPELVAHMKATGGVAGYSGPCWADWIPIDIDGAGVDPVADALGRTCALLAWIESKGARLDALSCWFSGGKGFHVLLPNVGLAPEPGPDFRVAARAFVESMGRESGCGPDTAIYDAVRIFRAPNTRHPKSGLYKVSITADELLRISADGVRRLASEPRPGDVPEPGAWCDWALGGLWGTAHNEAKARAVSVDPASRVDLNRATLDFIRSGAVNGERTKRLFQAAANLGEFGADERLAAALLMTAALDSGFSPTETRRVIAGGVAHGRRAAS
ncbi:MAG: hypothetical protein GX580_17220 [Candidatus Hydrogenedens sp.]|nr:hypothetical protein [Candidatus Hydrogenedens sp.]